MKRPSHIDAKGNASMVDVSGKRTTKRTAKAKATVHMRAETLSMIQSGGIPKGDVLAAARIAGIMAAKRTHDLIPLCHPLEITSVSVDFEPDEKNSLIRITAGASVKGRTGVEMEALTAATVSALTIYDMCKSVDRGMTIGDVMLIEKKGGKSGRYLKRPDKRITS